MSKNIAFQIDRMKKEKHAFREQIVALEQELAKRKDAHELFRDEFDTVKGEYKALEARNAELVQELIDCVEELKGAAEMLERSGWKADAKDCLLSASSAGDVILKAETNRTEGAVTCRSI